MDRALTVEELKQLEAGDWVWIVDEEWVEGRYREIAIQNEREPNIFYTVSPFAPARVYSYSDYGAKWVAYVNKQAFQSICKFAKNGRCTNGAAEAINCPTETYDKGSDYTNCDWFESIADRKMTVLQLRALPCDDWVWIKDLRTKEEYYAQKKQDDSECYFCAPDDTMYDIFTYDTAWIAYKNKESAIGLTTVDKVKEARIEILKDIKERSVCFANEKFDKNHFDEQFAEMLEYYGISQEEV